MHRDALLDLHGHHALHGQVAHLVGVFDVRYGEEARGGRMIGTLDGFVDGRRPGTR